MKFYPDALESLAEAYHCQAVDTVCRLLRLCPECHRAQMLRAVLHQLSALLLLSNDALGDQAEQLRAFRDGLAPHLDLLREAIRKRPPGPSQAAPSEGA